MDTFMDKLAQKLTAQEMIRANSAAETEEMEQLREQVKEYKECLDRLEQLLEGNLEKMQSVQVDSSSIERLVEEGIDEDFYQRVKRAAFGSNLRGLNSFENVAVSLTEGYFHGYDPFRFPQVFDDITKQDISDFLRDNIIPERSVFSEILPKE